MASFKVLINWKDCNKLLPYRDFDGHLRMPNHTQRRLVERDGKEIWQYREREENDQEWDARIY